MLPSANFTKIGKAYELEFDTLSNEDLLRLMGLKPGVIDTEKSIKLLEKLSEYYRVPIVGFRCKKPEIRKYLVPKSR